MSITYPIPLSSSLARRLAEAADGLRNVNHVYFIAGYEPPHPIKDFRDYDSAHDYFVDKGYSEDEYAIFGPYKTIDELEDLNLVGVEEIEKVTLTLYFKDSTHKKITLPGGIDSIFFNLSSFEKFVFPYYCHLYGVEYAKKLRDNLISQYKQSPTSQKIMAAAKSPHANVTYMINLYEQEELP